MVNTTRTQLALSVGEFDRCTIGNETIITFCMKEVRAFLTFSESAGVPITVNFETTGKYVYAKILIFSISFCLVLHK